MKTIPLMIASAGLLLTLAGPAKAHESGYHGYDTQPRYRHFEDRRRAMPRWLKRHKNFRRWYKHSRYKRRQSISWERLFEIYSWERRHYWRRNRDW